MSDIEESKTNVYIRYSALGFQMAAIIGVLSWLGNYIDNQQQNNTPIFTIIFSLLGVSSSLYLIIKEVSKTK